MKRLPIIKWLLSMLTAADNHRLEWNLIKAALDLEFAQEEAERQLDTAVRWGRYAELVAYDDNKFDDKVFNSEGAAYCGRFRQNGLWPVLHRREGNLCGDRLRVAGVAAFHSEWQLLL